MKKLMKKFEDIMVAITFAEAGEYDEASRCEGNASEQETPKPLDVFKSTAVDNVKK